MPNWCYNDLRISGSTKAITEIRQKRLSYGGEYDWNKDAIYLDLNKIDPTPEIFSKGELANLFLDTKPFLDEFQLDSTRARIAQLAEKHNLSVPLDVRQLSERLVESKSLREDIKEINSNEHLADALAQAADIIDDVGTIHWRDWRYAHWGTKWNTDPICTKITPNSIHATYDTAWCPPKAALEKLAELHPSIKMTNHYEEPGMGYRGDISYNYHDGFNDECEDWLPYDEDN